MQIACVSINVQLVSHCYTAVWYEPISKLYIYKNSVVYLSDARIMFIYLLHDTGIEKPDYWSMQFETRCDTMYTLTYAPSVVRSVCYSLRISITLIVPFEKPTNH